MPGLVRIRLSSRGNAGGWVEMRRWRYADCIFSISLRATPGQDLEGIVVVSRDGKVVTTIKLIEGFRSPNHAVEELVRIGESYLQ